MTTRKKKTIQDRATQVHMRLATRYPAPKAALNWNTPWELLVATVLSAQCTDERVNKVTPGVFAKWPTSAALCGASQTELEEVIRSTGFFRNKAKNLLGAARLVEEEYAGQLPTTMEEMLRLPGVARKTANVVLSNAFGVHAGIAVDTHVKRISFRLGFTTQTSPDKVEQDILPLFAQKDWGDVNHMLVFFGREVCKARKPMCGECELADICPRCGVK